MRLCAVLLLWAGACSAPSARVERVELERRVGASGPRVLAVFAHPDDETAFAGTLYKITTHLDGVCDAIVITNGEGGFKYSTLAERLYGARLTDETIGRERLPEIRRREMLDGAAILGLRSVRFLGQSDHRYTTDVEEVLGDGASVWDLDFVRAELAHALASEHYDFVFALAPLEESHAHHQAATALAGAAVLALPEDTRPVMLVTQVVREGERSNLKFAPEEDGAPIGPFRFDRMQRFGYRERLDYRIVVNWEIAAHKSQGTMQLAMNQGRFEEFVLFADRRLSAANKAAELFARLAEPQYTSPTYGPSAGVEPAAER